MEIPSYGYLRAGFQDLMQGLQVYRLWWDVFDEDRSGDASVERIGTYRIWFESQQTSGAHRAVLSFLEATSSLGRIQRIAPSGLSFLEATL